jgi:hypothetical protein
MVLIMIFLIPFTITTESILKKHREFKLEIIVQSFDRSLWY